MNGAMSDPNYPRLSIGILLKEAIGCGHDIFIDLKGSGFGVVRVALRQQIATILPRFLVRPHSVIVSA
jgi:hypothetical protein